MNYQWYPGHMTKAIRQMEEDVKLVDLIIELVDARIPLSSRNPDIDRLGQNKGRIVLLNKSDLADDAITEEWIRYFEARSMHALRINARDKGTLRRIDDLVKEACKEKLERDKKRGIINRPLRAMVVGIPNVGKSTFINSFAGRACAKTGNKPGVTKGKQWIKLNKTLELLDTPGILWPKFEDREVGLRLALIGSINDEILHIDELCYELLSFLKLKYPQSIKDRYGITIKPEEPDFTLLERIATIRNILGRGAEPDIQRMAQIILDEYRSGRLGRMSLEAPEV